jgi:tetratricopeptide (TPR) repeat protein
MSAGKLEEAAAALRSALDIIPSYGDAAFALVELEQGRGQLRAALHVLVDLLTLDPYNLEGLIKLGEVLERAGRWPEAARAYQRVLHFDPGHGLAMDGLDRVRPRVTGR